MQLQRTPCVWGNSGQDRAGYRAPHKCEWRRGHCAPSACSAARRLVTADCTSSKFIALMACFACFLANSFCGPEAAAEGIGQEACEAGHQLSLIHI